MQGYEKMNYDNVYHKSKFGNIMENELAYKLRGEYFKKYYLHPYYRDKYDADDKGLAVLEYGCGVGQNIAVLKGHAYELNKELYPFLKSKGIKLYDLLSDIPNDKFDLIFTCMVLEHLDNPMETIKFLRSKLKPKGILISIVPVIDYKTKHELNSSTDGHLQGWGFYELNCLLNKCGFTNIENRKVYRRGLERFARLGSFSINLYFLAVNLLGKVLNEYDIMVISRRTE